MRIGEEYKSELMKIRARPLADLPVSKDRWEERSDVDKLCAHPLVSVFMTAYNQSKYIRRALDSILEQECDFEYEIIIGEDCSTDNTREICFEYQKRFPDKIRVLFSDENTRKKYGCYLVNSYRVHNSCRGEYEAWLEADDFWIDRQKLRKQVSVLQSYPSVGLVYSDGCTILADENHPLATNTFGPSRVIPQKKIWSCLQRRQDIGLRTATMMWRRSWFIDEVRQYAIYEWAYDTGDITLQNVIAMHHDFYYLNDRTGCYRAEIGITSRNGESLHLDTITSTVFWGLVTDCQKIESHPLYARAFRTRLQELFCISRKDGVGLWGLVFKDRMLGHYAAVHPSIWLYTILVQLGARGFHAVRNGFSASIRKLFLNSLVTILMLF